MPIHLYFDVGLSLVFVKYLVVPDLLFLYSSEHLRPLKLLFVFVLSEPHTNEVDNFTTFVLCAPFDSTNRMR